VAWSGEPRERRRCEVCGGWLVRQTERVMLDGLRHLYVTDCVQSLKRELAESRKQRRMLAGRLGQKAARR
jgi:hypothetical protein